MTTAATGSKATLTQHCSAGLDVTTFEGHGLRELHLTLHPLPGEPPAAAVNRLVAVLKEHGASVVRQEMFGAPAAQSEILQAMRQQLGAVNWPVTCVHGANCTGEMLFGLHVFAVAGVQVEDVHLGGHCIGRTFSDKWARYVLLGDVRPSDVALSKPQQARQAYENIEAALRVTGMSMANVARTWLFLDDILSWYGPLNAVRTEFYRQRGMFDRMVPASTGVSGRNPAGAAIVAGTFAAEPLNGTFTMCEVASPRQCEATNYGSSFSRAVALGNPALQRLMISGTASIEPGGKSVGDDVETQIDLTMEVVRAILVAREMDYTSASRVTAYFKYPQDVKHFDAWRAKNGLKDWPIVCTQADICRDELLFEIELDALAVPPSSS